MIRIPLDLVDELCKLYHAEDDEKLTKKFLTLVDYPSDKIVECIHEYLNSLRTNDGIDEDMVYEAMKRMVLAVILSGKAVKLMYHNPDQSDAINSLSMREAEKYFEELDTHCATRKLQ